MGPFFLCFQKSVPETCQDDEYHPPFPALFCKVHVQRNWGFDDRLDKAKEMYSSDESSGVKE